MSLNLSDKTYVQLISKAVEDFDSIFNALKAKGVQKDGANIVVNNGTLPTEEYDDLITNQLVKVNGVTDVKTLTLSSGIMDNRSNLTSLDLVSGSSGTLTYGDTGALAVTVAVPAGYYDGDDLNVSIPLSKIGTNSYISLSGQLSAGNKTGYKIANGSNNDYVITPDNGTIITSLSIKKGTVDVSIGEDNDGLGDTKSPFTNNLVVSVDSTSEAVDTLSAVKYVATQSDSQDVYRLKIKTSSKLSGTVTANVTATMKPGYINDFTTKDLTGSETFTDVTGGSAEHYIEISKGGISGIAGSASSTIGTDSNIKTVETAANGYEITSTTNASIDTSKASITEGYIKEGAITIGTDEVTKTGDTIYIKKGSLGSATSNAADLTSGLTVTDNFSETQDGAYTITADLSKKYSKAIVDGYVTQTAFEADLSGTKTLSVAHGSVKITSAGNNISQTGSTNIIQSGTPSAGAYSIDVTATAKTSKNVTEGYVKPGDVTNPASITGTTTYYVNKGSVTVEPSVSVKAVNVEDGKTGDDSTAESFASLFTTTQPAKGDYYSIESGVSTKTVNEGYIKSGDITASAITKYYIPKATFKYIENSDSGNILEVEKGGYVPSGTITSIAEISGTLDKAAVTVAIDSAKSGDIFKSSKAASDYVLTLTKGNINAGYISETEGTLTGEVYVSHGSVAITQTPTNITLDATPTTVAADKSTYTFSKSEAQVAGFTSLVPGYIKQTDIDVSQVSKDATATLTLNAATFATKAGSKATLKIESSDINIEATSADGYAITSDIDSGNITIATTTAGYLASGEERAATVSADTKTVYVKKGTPLTNAAASLADSDANMTSKEKGTTLVVTLPAKDLTISGTLEEGYYKSAAEKAVSGTAKIGAQTYTVGAGAAKARVLTSSNDITSSDGVVLASSKANGKEYLSITATANQTLSASVTTHGYLSADSQITLEQPSASSSTKFVEVWKSGTTEGVSFGDETQTVNVLTVGDTTAKDPTATVQKAEYANAGTYNKYNTKVVLGEHAMGTAVANQFEVLRKRLEGNATA